MASMAYPYMNGTLHAGHGLTLSKVEFAVGFQKMLGRRVLFPLGFHCTGMPISACADRLKREVGHYGKDFIVREEKYEPIEDMVTESSQFKGKKSKHAAKTGREKYQFEIMLQLGIPRDEIHKFSDPQHWLTHFPPLCRQDCDRFGARIDWRRSMITTDMNPYYDRFVRWQIQQLKDLGKIKFGERYTIYSPTDGQPCMDHDRQLGEGVTPQEYTGVKIEVVEFTSPTDVWCVKGGKKAFLVAGTLRPETLCGQTACFVSPDISYGVFDNGDCYLITTVRSYLNMSYQKLTPSRGSFKIVQTVDGSKLIGSKVRTPWSVYPEVRVLPMESIFEAKGTAVVACVPSDSPDDYITCEELKRRPERYGIDPQWILSPVSVIRSKYGDQCAPILCEQFKINSPKELEKLVQAKDAAYKEASQNGVMIVGKHTGEKVETVRLLVRESLIEHGHAFIYAEPESKIVSRTGDECVVSLEDQWYVDYGEPEWKSLALEGLYAMKHMNPITVHAFEGVLEWLQNWAVCRTYGLGTKIPWDEKYLVESLSDSTIYQAYYTICHLLHTDFYGKEKGELNIDPEQMTPAVFDYIFLHKDIVTTDIPLDVLNKLRQEFDYFYPLDASISGKDLIPNHLTFFIYTHTAIFPRDWWPRGIRVNGHLLLNNNKMSKSTGNFMTLAEVLNKFGADATRIALADAGDTVDDANFEEATANAAVLRLHTLKEWCEDVVVGCVMMRGGTLPDSKRDIGAFCDCQDSEEYTLMDRCFDNEMNVLVQHCFQEYEQTNYKQALRAGFFDFQALRDFYRDTIDVMHRSLVMKYIHLQALLLTPIAPHFCEFLWREILGHSTTVQNQNFPQAGKTDPMLSIRLEYIRSLLHQIREVESAKLKQKRKFGREIDPDKPVRMRIFIASDFPEWQVQYMELAKQLHAKGKLQDLELLKGLVGGDIARAMPYLMHLAQRAEKESPSAVFDHAIQYEEAEMIAELGDKVLGAPQFVKLSEIQVVHFSHTSDTVDVSGEIVVLTKRIRKAIPGEPVVMMENC